MGEIGYFWKNADNQLPAEGGFSSTPRKPQPPLRS